MTLSVYVVGPVTGVEGLNRDEFERVRGELARAGYAARIPHDYVPECYGWEAAMRASVTAMLRCDGVALLDGWQASRGARIERDLAKSLGMFCMGWRGWVEGGPL